MRTPPVSALSTSLLRLDRARPSATSPAESSSDSVLPRPSPRNALAERLVREATARERPRSTRPARRARRDRQRAARVARRRARALDDASSGPVVATRHGSHSTFRPARRTAGDPTKRAAGARAGSICSGSRSRRRSRGTLQRRIARRHGVFSFVCGATHERARRRDVLDPPQRDVEPRRSWRRAPATRSQDLGAAGDSGLSTSAPSRSSRSCRRRRSLRPRRGVRSRDRRRARPRPREDAERAWLRAVRDGTLGVGNIDEVGTSTAGRPAKRTPQRSPPRSARSAAASSAATRAARRRRDDQRPRASIARVFERLLRLARRGRTGSGQRFDQNFERVRFEHRRPRRPRRPRAPWRELALGRAPRRGRSRASGRAVRGDVRVVFRVTRRRRRPSRGRRHRTRRRDRVTESSSPSAGPPLSRCHIAASTNWTSSTARAARGAGRMPGRTAMEAASRSALRRGSSDAVHGERSEPSAPGRTVTVSAAPSKKLNRGCRSARSRRR
jgi:hypothetical protein